MNETPTAEDAGTTHGRMPALFMSHGGPTLGENAEWAGERAQWGRDLPRP